MTRPIDPAALGELLDRHGPALALYARQWTQWADDCVQEALIELAAEIPPPDQPAGWLYRVVRRRALNAARGGRRRELRERTAGERRQREATQAGEQTVLGIELADELLQMGSADREIVVLRIWGALSWEEIAAIVDVSKSAAQRRYVAALGRLRVHWESETCPKK